MFEFVLSFSTDPGLLKKLVVRKITTYFMFWSGGTLQVYPAVL